MAAKKVFILVILVYLIIIFPLSLALLWSQPSVKTVSGSKLSLSNLAKTNSKLPNGNGAVTNIWIDSYQRLDVLKNSGVKYLIVDVGATNSDGTLKSTPQEINNFLNLITNYQKDRNYNFTLLPYSEINSYNTAVTSQTFISNYITTYKELSQRGFNGILVDIEPVQFSQRDSYISLLDSLKSDLPKSSIISVYAGPLIDDHTSEWAWDSQFYRTVSQHVDLISASGYDTSLTDGAAYQLYIINQIKAISSENLNSKVLFALPTHKPYPENFELALQAYSEGIKENPTQNIIGLTVFAEWTAKPQDWDLLRKFSFS